MDLELHLLPEKFIRPLPSSKEIAGEGLAEALAEAVAHPVNFPALNESVFPGDRVAIVLQSKICQPLALLKGMIEMLLDCGIEPADIEILVTRETARSIGANPEAAVMGDLIPGSETESSESFGAIPLTVHDPADEHSMAYLAASEAGLPIMVNRKIVDADVVIPIGFPTTKDSGEISLVDHSIYPRFSNQESIYRYQKQMDSESVLNGEVRLVNSNLAAYVGIQVVRGPGQAIREVLYGNRDEIVEMAQQRMADAWTIDRQSDTGMTVVTIEDESESQSWNDFARALVVANRVAESSGPIVVWSELKQTPTSAVRKACTAEFGADVGQLSDELREVSSIVAERGVYLKSRLSQTVVEDMGIGFISAAEDLSRMIGSIESGIFIRDAHRCHVNLEKENVGP